MRPTRLNDCQYLLISPINQPLTNFANHTKDMSHDAINRFLSKDQMTPRLVWDNVRDSITPCADGDLVFDDTIVDQDFSHRIELVRRQYSGNARGIIKGIGVVTCVYINPHTAQYWVIDDRIDDPDGDGQSKLDHVQDKLLPFRTVLMEPWYATKDLMLFIESKHVH